MSPAKYLNTSAMIDAADYVFRASGSVVTFEGMLEEILDTRTSMKLSNGG